MEHHFEASQLPEGCRVLLIHALNPEGYHDLRRFDRRNIDLNRHFLLEDEAYSGSDPLYRKLDGLLNPSRAPGYIDTFWFEAILLILRHGEPALRRAVATGQYDFEKGLFFGGHTASPVLERLRRAWPTLVGSPRQVLHLDVHTGLGRWGNLALLLEQSTQLDRVAWLRSAFPNERVEWAGEGIAYPVRGGFGTWCQAMSRDAVYDYICAEFGTYPGLKVLAALRAENRIWHWGNRDSRSYRRALSRLGEVFTPRDRTWRSTTLDRGLSLVCRGLRLLSQPIAGC